MAPIFVSKAMSAFHLSIVLLVMTFWIRFGECIITKTQMNTIGYKEHDEVRIHGDKTMRSLIFWGFMGVYCIIDVIKLLR